MYSDIDEATLDDNVHSILLSHPNTGEVMMKGYLKHRHITVPRKDLRKSLRRIDGGGADFRRRRRLHRRVYSVEGPNHLWHIDGNHKLIRWGFVVHGGVDGYSRLPVYLKCSTNNRSSTVLTAFQEAVEMYGLPLRVRSDAGGENVKVWQYITQKRGEPGLIVGKSTHNQRIERLWGDVFQGCLQYFYQLFSHLENSGDLDTLDEIQLFALQYVFTPRINRSLQDWFNGWINHKIRTENRKTPLQLWVDGQVEQYTGFDDVLQENVVADLELDERARGHVVVEEPRNLLMDEVYHQLQEEISPLRPSSQHGVDVYCDVLQYISNNVIDE